MALDRASLSSQLLALGVKPGGTLLVHSSLSSLGHVAGGADTLLDALLDALGPDGTLAVPTLSYLFVTPDSPRFNITTTPSNVGALSAAVLRRAGAHRSEHPTHSVAALGPLARALTASHELDRTPVGPNSPFRRVPALAGQLLFLGCGARCNTTIHGVEELLTPQPPYLLLQSPITYTITKADGTSYDAVHRRHDCADTGQRYERLAALVPQGAYVTGRVGAALAELFDARAMWDTALAALRADPLALVERVVGGEGHVLRASPADASFAYSVVQGH